MNPVIVVGSGIAGIRAAEALRTSGYLGEIAIISPEIPCYRPAVSKEALTGSSAPANVGLPMKRPSHEFTWLLGAHVQRADLTHQTLEYTEATGSQVTTIFDGLVIASGLRARHLNVPGPKVGRFTLRQLDDAQKLQPLLGSGRHVVIIGSGFIGCEVAAIARSLGCHVTVISPEPVPLSGAIGEALGTRVAMVHEDHGVEIRTNASVVAFTGEDVASGVLLADGTHIQADVIVEAVGSDPNVEWLNGNALDLTNGVLVDPFLQAVGTTSPVVACGDIARHPNALFGPMVRRIEHWTTAGDLGTHAGRTLAHLLNDSPDLRTSFSAVPTFWSDQFDLQLQSFGIPALGTQVEVIESDEDGCIAEYRDSSGLVGVVGLNRTSEVATYRKQLSARS